MELCYVLLVLGVFSVTCGQMVDQWKVQEFPNPIYQVEACGRSESLDKSWICDPNKVISEQDVNDISDMLDDIYKNTRCNCQTCIDDKNGYVVMVAIMPRMYRIVNASSHHNDVMVDARIYAYYLSLYWSNFANCKQVVLVLFSRDDGVVYTLTQKDARTKLTDELVTEITLENQRYFDTNERTKMGMGLKSMIDQYRQALKGQRQ